MKTVVFIILLSVHCEFTIALRRQHYFINEAKTWREAQIYCRENYDDFSCVDSPEGSWQLVNAINVGTTHSYYHSTWSNPYHYIETWIGLNKISSNSWQCSDGTGYSGSVYYDYYPNQCITFHYSQLRGANCEIRNLPFFCYKWEPELILVKENKSWEDALQHCRTHYRDLASLPTNLHQIQAKQTTAIAETVSVWTGLRFLSGSWFWLSGEDLEDLIQLPTCPANRSYCGSLNMKTQSWENKDCMEKFNFVCY